MSVEQELSCPAHPASLEPKDFYLYEGKKPRCRACVTDGRARSREKAKASGGKAPGSAPDPGPVPAPVRPAKAQDGPPLAPDDWGPYKGMSKEQIRRRKNNRGQPGMFGTMVWLTPEEWKARESWMRDYAEALAKKFGH